MKSPQKLAVQIAPEKEPQVLCAVARINSAIIHLDELLSRLGGRLETVLHTPSVGECNATARAAFGTPLAEQIQCGADRVEDLIFRVEDFLDRLEV